MASILVIRFQFSKEFIKLLIEGWFIFSTSMKYVHAGIDIELDLRYIFYIKLSLIGIVMRPELYELYTLLENILSTKVFASSLRRLDIEIL